MRFKVTVPQISKEERAIVVENFSKEKATLQFKQHFNNDLIRHHLAKNNPTKR